MSIVGLSTEILDGKLSPKPSLPKDVTIIIDRALDGPSDVLYSVTDTERVKNIYGSSSPIIQAMRQAYASGSKNVALYRIGGSGAVINNLFGAYTLLSTVSQKIGAGSTLKVYAGPRQTDPTRSVITVTEGKKIVYSTAPGRSVDLGVVNVEGFDDQNFPYQIGTVNDPVAFNEILTQLRKKTTEDLVATAAQTDFTLTTPVESISSVSKIVNDVRTVLVAGTDYTTVAGTGTTIAGVTLTTALDADDILEVIGLTTLTSQELIDNEIKYTPAKDSMNVSYNKLYGLYDKAFIDLESVNALSVVVGDLFNVPNIAAGDPSTADRLSYVIRTEQEDGFSYEWSDSKFIYQLATDVLLTTTDPNLAALDDTGQPVIVKSFNEVDFTHRLGMWAWGQSNASTYVNANIGSRGHAANYTVAINRWVGKPPVKNIYGDIVENGTGLLGNRFMAGTTTRAPGFYATDTGYPDGTPITDSSGVIIDIGKYLSISVTPIYITSENYSGNTVNIRSASAAYAGLVSNITPGDSTTNQVLPNVSPLFDLKRAKIEALSAAGYVVLETRNKGVTVYSGDLATQSVSDYDYISTAIAVTYVLGRIREITDPYIGRGVSSVLMAAFHNTIDMELRGAMSAGYINGYEFNLLSNGTGRLMLPITLREKDELRSITTVLSLSENVEFSI